MSFPFTMPPRLYAEMLFSVAKHKKASMCLREKIYELDKFRSGPSYSAVGCIFKVSESTIYIT